MRRRLLAERVRSSGLGGARGRWLTLLAALLLLAIGAALIAAHVTVFSLDESLIQQSAVHYSSNLPHSLLHDVDARATSRLYPLVLSIAYRITGGPAAVRIDHVLSVLMFVSAAAPIFLMARLIVRSSWSAVAVALLSVAVPWLTLTSALYTENLSYPIFWWVMLATCAAVWQPTPRRDLWALISIGLLVGTRVQFVAVFVGYLLCVSAICLWRAPSRSGRGGWAWRGLCAARLAARSFPFTAAGLALVVAVLIYARAFGQWHAHVEHLFGSYSNVIIRSSLPPNMAEGLLVEVIALALGVGLLPAIISIPWFLRSIARPALERRWVYLAACALMLVVFLVLTVYSQGGYLGSVTEERYFFYAIPAFWIGCFAAIAEGHLRPGELLASALALAGLFGVIPFLAQLTEETAFLTPVESVTSHVITLWTDQLGLTGLTVQDAMALITLIVGGLLAALRLRRSPWLVGLAITLAATVQLLITGYAFAVIDGKVPGVQGRTSGNSASLGWVDRAAGADHVTWLQNIVAGPPPAIEEPAAGLAADQAHVTLFWNSAIRTAATSSELDPLPLEFPLTALPSSAVTVAKSSGALAPASAAAGLQGVVGQTDSPFLQLAGTTLGHSPDGFLTLTSVTQPAHAVWLSRGLNAEGAVTAEVPARVWAFPTGGAAGLTVRFTMSQPAAVTPSTPGAIHTSLRVDLGSQRRLVTLASGAPATVLTMRACTPRGAVLTGMLSAQQTLATAAGPQAAVLDAVSVEHSPAGACPAAHP